MSNKWTSRKFWTAIVGQVVGIVALIYGTSTAGQVEAVAGAIIIIASILGYLKAEKDVDVAKAKNGY